MFSLQLISYRMLAEQTQIIDLSEYNKSEIFQKIKEILMETDQFDTFTLLIKRSNLLQKNLQAKELKTKQLNNFFSLVDQHQNLDDKLTIERKARISNNQKSQTVKRLLKKNSSIFSHRSKDGLKVNDSLSNQSSQDKQIPKSLQLYYSGEYEQALEQFFLQQKQLKQKISDLSLNIATKNLFMQEYSKLLINIGNCYFYQKDYEKAMTYFKTQILTNIDEKLIGQKYNNLGSCYAYKKQNQQSLKCFNQAFKIYAKYPELDCSNLLKNIGIIYFRNGMYTSAEDYFQQSINERKLKSSDNQQALLNTYYKLALCQKYTHKLQQAINNLLFGSNISEKGFALHDSILKELAQIYQIQDRFSQALAYYEKISDIYERNGQCQGQIYQNVAKIHQKLGNFNQHEKFMRLAIAEYRRFNIETKLSELMSRKSFN